MEVIKFGVHTRLVSIPYIFRFCKKGIKNAYAASFGVEIVPEETIKEYSRRLKTLM